MHVVCEIVYLDLSMIYLDLVEVDSVDAARLKARPLLGVTGIESTHVHRVHMLDRPSTCSTLKWEHSLFVPVEFGQNCKIQTPVLSDVLSVCVSCSSTFFCFFRKRSDGGPVSTGHITSCSSMTDSQS